jgi:[ribosomal protein S18]-alanine N-acetyltransferase
MMRIPFLKRPVREFAIAPLEPGGGQVLAELHREDFVRPWTDGEFEQLLAEDTVFGFAGMEIGKGGTRPVGFVLARIAAGEAEILTLAVARSHRRAGLGWQLMDAVLRELHAARAEALFLEVDETNLGAIALYRRLGFHQVGKRPAYYKGADNRRTGALVMRRDLR